MVQLSIDALSVRGSVRLSVFRFCSFLCLLQIFGSRRPIDYTLKQREGWGFPRRCLSLAQPFFSEIR